MELVFLGIIAFLFLLAAFDLSVGVSNDAVNFLNSSLGSKTAKFKHVMIVAAIGVFIGASMSNGMMDIARHGIFRPEYFSFYDVICIYMAVMVTDIILLDLFNTFGMPTSTTVSMVFELLGATVVVAVLKSFGNDVDATSVTELINTEKAFSVILGIFLSVAIAFFFGTVVQFITRTIFSFNYKHNLKWKIGIFGGVCATAIVYFLLLKGMKDLTFMTPEVKAWTKEHTFLILCYCFTGFTIIMQLLHILKVNVLKVIVFMGTFALAMAFAGNDLVNFIGVPLSGFSAYQDFSANGAGNPDTFLMNSLNAPANTPVYFLIIAGAIMVISLATSKKARRVTQTEIGLGSQNGGEEMFGSSRLARRLVRMSTFFFSWVRDHTPMKIRLWIHKRFDTNEAIMEKGAAFDLVRGTVNLVLAGALIALGTSLKLPLSTTFVTFMVAMGTSLADRAWSRESAVFRITGVLSVIGGWFLTALIAFVGAGIIVLVMHFGGLYAMLIMALLTIVLIVRNNIKFKEKKADEADDAIFQTMVNTQKAEEIWPLLLMYLSNKQSNFIAYVHEKYDEITDAFINEDLRTLDKAEASMMKQKVMLKNTRRKETLCLRNVAHETAIEKSTWFYLSNNCCMSMLYNLRRINEVCKEHLENNFLPLPDSSRVEFFKIRDDIDNLLLTVLEIQETKDYELIVPMREECDRIKDVLADCYHKLYAQLREGNPSDMTVLYVYLNLLQETQEMISNMRKHLRAYAKLSDYDYANSNVKEDVND